jgi:hypothetical protein
MNRILVFSRKDKLYDIDREFSWRDDVNHIDESGMLFFNEQDNLFYPVKGLQDYGLYLMYDQMKPNFFNTVIQGIDKNDVLFLIHSDPKFLSAYPNVYDGTNESIESGGRVYPYVIAILQDELPEKIKRVKDAIIKINPLLEAKIRFIDSLFSSNTPHKLDQLLLPFKNEIELFQKNKNDDVFSPEFLKAFEKLMLDLKLEK